MARIIFDVDGDGVADPLSDSLLILRYFSGLRGEELITDALSVGAVRTEAPDIEGYIRNIWCYLDIDGDGEVTWGDLLLLHRYLFGFTGDVLIDGAVAAGAIRPTSDLIVAYIEQFTTDLDL